MRMPNLGDTVEIDLLDHSSNEKDDSVFPVTAHGRVHLVDADRIVIDCWYATDPDHIRKMDKNELETFAIVRRAIKAIRRVTEMEDL